jgi:hypothetical protein
MRSIQDGASCRDPRRLRVVSARCCGAGYGGWLRASGRRITAEKTPTCRGGANRPRHMT